MRSLTYLLEALQILKDYHIVLQYNNAVICNPVIFEYDV